jgi:hypothetical protein
MIDIHVMSYDIRSIMVCLLCLLQDMYDNLSHKIEDVTLNSTSFQFEGEYAVFLNTEKRNHSSIVKVTNIVKNIHASITTCNPYFLGRLTVVTDKKDQDTAFSPKFLDISKFVHC